MSSRKRDTTETDNSGDKSSFSKRESLKGHSSNESGSSGVDEEQLRLLLESSDLSLKLLKSVGEIEELWKLVDQRIERQLSKKFERAGFVLRSGRTAGQIWDMYGWPHLMGAASWFSNQLIQKNCHLEHFRGELGKRTARLFDPDRAEVWVNSGGRSTVERYISERLGQTSFHHLLTR